MDKDILDELKEKIKNGEATDNGSIKSFMDNNLTEEQKQKVNLYLNNPEAVKGLIKNKDVQSILQKLFGGDKA